MFMRTEFCRLRKKNAFVQRAQLVNLNRIPNYNNYVFNEMFRDNIGKTAKREKSRELTIKKVNLIYRNKAKKKSFSLSG